MAKAPRQLINARRVIDVLAVQENLTPGELAQRMEIPRSTSYRLLAGLQAVDLVRAASDGTYVLSQRWLRLADASRNARREWLPARLAVQELSERTGCTAYLSVRDGWEALCLDWMAGRATEVLLMAPGRSLPLHVGAEGRTILAALDDGEVEAYLARGDREEYTPRTLISADEIRADVAMSRAEGVTSSHEDCTVGVDAIGIAISAGGVPGCLSLAALTGELESRRRELTQELRRARDSIRP